jgi:hypothetical protein
LCPIIGTVRVPFRSAPLAGGHGGSTAHATNKLQAEQNRTYRQTDTREYHQQDLGEHQPTASLEAAAVAAVFGVALSAPPPSEGGIPGHLANSDAKHVAPG